MSRAHRLRDAWDGRVDSWSEAVEAGPAFARLRERVLELAGPLESDRCVDLGAGSGFLTLPLAERVQSVIAVDLSDEMLRVLRGRLGAAEVAKVQTSTMDMGQFDAPAGSVDLVISSYALHYLADRDKEELLRRARRWLVPSGRIVIADMMIGLRWDDHHRGVFREQALLMLRRGLPGWWRLLKNAVRIGTGRGRLRPRSSDWWISTFEQAGFVEVNYEHVASEAGIIAARVPPAPVVE